MPKRLLVFAWEYRNYHSAQGAALARRITQVSEAFAANGWLVTVIHADHRNESGVTPFFVAKERSGVTRISVKPSSQIDAFPANALLRKLQTFYYISFRGDRSALWADDVIQKFAAMPVEKPDAIIAFFTPRGPLILGEHYAAKFDVPWIADLQDPIWEGVSASLEKMCIHWMRRNLKSARGVVQVSPEWAVSDGAAIGRSVKSIRHIIPSPFTLPTTATLPNKMKPFADCFRIFYGGSISAVWQSPQLLAKVLDEAETLQQIKAKVFLAGNENSLRVFTDVLGADRIVYLGWLDNVTMAEYIAASQCLLVVPCNNGRDAIPSKIFEYLSFQKPIWISGAHLGSFSSLFKEWGYPDIPTGDFAFQFDLLARAAKGDFSGMLRLEDCVGKVVTEDNVYAIYSDLLA